MGSLIYANIHSLWVSPRPRLHPPSSCRPGYESVQTPRVHPPSVSSSSPTNVQATPPISAAGSGSNSPVPTPFPSATSGLTRVASTRGSPTQELLTEPSVGMGGALSSSAQPGSGNGGQNADSSVSTPTTILPRTGSIIQQRRERRAIIGTPLTRQQHYLSRNYLHHDLQLPDGYGELVGEHVGLGVPLVEGYCPWSRGKTCSKLPSKQVITILRKVYSFNWRDPLLVKVVFVLIVSQ